MGDVLLDFVQLDEQVHREDLLAEVALVERAFQDRLVQPLELREGELPREQLEADRLVADLPLQPPEGGGEDVGVVEGQAGPDRQVLTGGILVNESAERNT